MARNLWIGRPGALREIDQQAKSWDRTAELGVTEFKSLGGRTTVVSQGRANRRIKLSWEQLDQQTAQFLDRLARRVDGPGAIAVIDPVSVNLLSASQAAGTGTPRTGGDGQWFVVANSGAGSLYESVTAPGSYYFRSDAPTAKVGWAHPYWLGFPVMPGMAVSFVLPSSWTLPTVVAQLDFKAADGSYLSSAVSAPGTRTVTTTVPAGAVFVTPVGQIGDPASTTRSLGNACLTIGSSLANIDTAVAGQTGEGCPPMSITNYSDTPAQHLPYRNISLDLTEVTSAT